MIDAAVRDLVRRRADERCEYCRLPQRAEEATFHVEHIVALQHAPPREELSPVTTLDEQLERLTAPPDREPEEPTYNDEEWPPPDEKS